MGGAPVAVSEDIQQYTVFLPNHGPRSIRMKTCAAICEINREGGTTQSGFNMLSGNGATAIMLNLTEPRRVQDSNTTNENYVSPVFDLLASAFTRYKIHSLKFHYEPQAAATTTERMVFAFAPDPIHPLITSTAPSSAKLLAVADSVAFAPWRSWTMDVSSHVRSKTFYTYSDPGTTTTVALSERFSDFGSIGCVTSSTETTALQCGILYMEVDVELIEFCPIVTTNPSSKVMAKKVLHAHEKEEDEVERRKKELASAPSSAPSGMFGFRR